jgi:IS5 family transposase
LHAAIGAFRLSAHLKRLSAHGDPLEELGRIIDFEAFRATFTTALAYGNGSKGGRPPYDPVAMLKVLILAAQNNVSDARMHQACPGQDHAGQSGLQPDPPDLL